MIMLLLLLLMMMMMKMMMVMIFLNTARSVSDELLALYITNIHN